jgi:glutathione S-transferase
LEYLSISEAKQHEGLRLVLTVGVPGPWGETAKGLFYAKGISYAAVAQEGGGENAELRDWVGHENAPVVVDVDGSARSGWAEIVLFAEARAPEPRLIPADPFERALMFGLCFEICGPDGFAWNRRLMMLAPLLANPDFAESPAGAPVRRLGSRYGYSPAAAEAAPARAASVLEMLSGRLAAQHERGSAYFIGDSLTALDIHWACFAALLQPLPEDQCAMPGFLRAQYGVSDPLVDAATVSILLEHRDLVYRQHLQLPLDF